MQDALSADLEFEVMVMPDIDLHWCRDWELLARCADILAGPIACHPSIVAARGEFASLVGRQFSPLDEFERTRFSDNVEPIINTAVARWVSLYRDWMSRRRTYVFDDGFSVLFLVRILWANDVVLYRGHYNSDWKLTSTWTRLAGTGQERLRLERERGRDFLSRVNNLNAVKKIYTSRIPLEHCEAILQHYGFPTRLIDLSYSADVGLYFAEGGASYNLDLTSAPALGALYAIPTWALPSSAHLLTLPPAIMRPSLQQGVFLADVAEGQLEELEHLKFRFAHRGSPIWNGLTGIQFGAPVDLTRYLFTESDQIAALLHMPDSEE